MSEEIRRPTFFIVGAPKCATTSLADWLAARPDVFMAAIKEPHFFNQDGGAAGIRDLATYEKLYRKAGPQHVAVGEASAGYLSSEVAIDRALAYAPEARLIACLRSPLEMLPSLHHQLVFNGTEPIADFERAWEAAEERRRTDWRASSGADWRIFHYRRMGFLGAQVSRMVARAGRERCLFVTTEALRADPRATFARVLRHIGADASEIGPLSSANRAKTARSPLLRQAMVQAGRLKTWLGITQSFGLVRQIDQINSVEAAWPPLSPAMAQLLRETYAEDIALLGEIIGEDLSPWLEETT
ncbi:MAG: sulfotransferase domain-containing protein [Pseudomonadota bacterium]